MLYNFNSCIKKYIGRKHWLSLIFLIHCLQKFIAFLFAFRWLHFCNLTNFFGTFQTFLGIFVLSCLIFISSIYATFSSSCPRHHHHRRRHCRRRCCRMHHLICGDLNLFSLSFSPFFPKVFLIFSQFTSKIFNAWRSEIA